MSLPIIRRFREAVRHPDYQTLHLDYWRRAVRNREVTASQVGDNGVFWFDWEIQPGYFFHSWTFNRVVLSTIRV
jgi:hypothetical protein